MNLAISGDRKSKMYLNEVYFWTNSIKDWNEILWADDYKETIIQSLKYLADNLLIKVYAFVIMPNHVHIVWKMLKMNGNELPNSSFSKFTSHQLVKKLKPHHRSRLNKLSVIEGDRAYRIWHRDPLAVLMDSRKKVEQKIDYIHDNPLGTKWNLVKNPEDYHWSSASYYEKGVDHFGFLTHYMEEF